MKRIATGQVRKTGALSVLVLVMVLAAGCGIYSTRPGSIPEHIKNVHIPMVENETAEFGLNEDVNGRITETVINENILALSDEAMAHSVLYLTCKSIDDKPYTFDETERVKEYRLTLTLGYRWYDTSTRKDLMSGTINQWAVYYSDSYNSELSGDDQLTREQARIEVAKKIAEDMVFQLVSDW